MVYLCGLSPVGLVATMTLPTTAAAAAAITITTTTTTTTITYNNSSNETSLLLKGSHLHESRGYFVVGSRKATLSCSASF